MRRFGYSNLENEFVNSGEKIDYLVVGNLILFPFQDALLFIEKCQKTEKKVLGVDGFRVIGDKIQPDQQETSEDYDNDDFNIAVEKAKAFLQEREKKGLWFEIVTETDS